MQVPNYYEILGIKPGASQEIIKERLNSKTKELRSLTHSPDKNVWQKAIEGLKVLSDARQILFDSQKCEEYDTSLQHNREGSSGTKEIPFRRNLIYSIVLMLDTSGSMSGKKIDDASEAIISFLEKVNLEKNEVALVTFGSQIIWTDGLTQNGEYIKKEIKDIALISDGGTPMMEAIRTACDKVLPKRRAKGVIVLATDGFPTDSPEEEILRYVTPIKKDGVRIITIGIGDDGNKEFLKKLATCPDDYYFAKVSFELRRVYKEVASELK